MFTSKLASLEARLARLESSFKTANEIPQPGDILILAYTLEIANFHTGEKEPQHFHFFFQVVSSNPKGNLILVQKGEDERGGGFVPDKSDVSSPFRAKWTSRGVKVPYLSTIYFAVQWDGRPVK